MLSGRTRQGKLIHFARVDESVRAGSLVMVDVTHGAPYHLLGDFAVHGSLSAPQGPDSPSLTRDRIASRSPSWDPRRRESQRSPHSLAFEAHDPSRDPLRRRDDGLSRHGPGDGEADAQPNAAK